MKRIIAIVTLCVALVLGATSCKKRTAEEAPIATEKGSLRIEKFEGIERGKGLSGEVILSVSNGLRSDITLASGLIVVKYGDNAVCTLTLTGEVVVPKRVISSVRVPVALDFSSPIVAYGVLAKVMRGELDKITLTVDAEAKIGIVNKHIYKENIPMYEAIRLLGIPADRLKALVEKQ